jgi:hypothetical protein
MSNITFFLKLQKKSDQPLIVPLQGLGASQMGFLVVATCNKFRNFGTALCLFLIFAGFASTTFFYYTFHTFFEFIID